MPHSIRTQQHKKLIKWLTDTRKRGGWRQADLAKRMGHSQAWMARVEAGERRVDVIEFLSFTRLLKCDPCEVLIKINRD